MKNEGHRSFDHDRSFRYEVAIRAGDDGLCIASEGGFLKNQHAVDREKEASLKEELSLQEDPFDLTRSFPQPDQYPIRSLRIPMTMIAAVSSKNP